MAIKHDIAEYKPCMCGPHPGVTLEDVAAVGESVRGEPGLLPDTLPFWTPILTGGLSVGIRNAPHAGGGFVLYPSRTNANLMQRVYQR